MEQQKVKEMFAVVFTFLVMGVIGFSVYEPEQKIADVDDLTPVQTTAALKAAEKDVQVRHTSDTISTQRVVQGNINTQ